MKDTATDSTTPATGCVATSQSATVVPSPASPSTERAADYTLYKPNARGNGGVLRFGLNPAKAAIFVDAAAQNGDKQFDWDNKITMKWGLSDVGPVLATLQGRQPQAKLFHQTDKANSAFELTLRDDPERAPYAMSMSRQDASDKSLRKVSLPITHAEAAVLEAALRIAVGRIIGW
ncbi:MAG: hypothetical protein DVB25_01865 [Verrucomicrobia bacterium]|nr:MAG: hypothetical protein DVB25_01865 [Verrucomicrobiota bacterium]